MAQHPDTFRVIGGNVSLLQCDDQDDNAHTPTESNSTYLYFNLTEPVSISSTVNSEQTSESDSFVPDSKVKLENLCDDNCPKLYETWYDFSTVHPLHQTLNFAVSSKSIQRATMPSSLNYFIDGAWEAKILQNSHVISTVSDSLRLTNGILDFDSTAGDKSVISFDCKGIHLGAYGTITLMHIGTTCGKAFVFDVLTCPQIMTDGGLRALLESDRVIKVIHDCRYVSANLYKQFQTKLRNVFDTQCAHAILQYQNNEVRVNQARSLSFNKLIELFYGPLNPMKNRLLPSQMSWKLRPLTQEMVTYAALNVLVLIDKQLYGSMAL